MLGEVMPYHLLLQFLLVLYRLDCSPHGYLLSIWIRGVRRRGLTELKLPP